MRSAGSSSVGRSEATAIIIPKTVETAGEAASRPISSATTPELADAHAPARRLGGSLRPCGRSGDDGTRRWKHRRWACR